MVNKLFLTLAKKSIEKIKDPETLIELSKWIIELLPVNDMVVMKINEKLADMSLTESGMRIRRIQALRNPEIAGMLIRAGCVPHESLACDSRGNLDTSVSLRFAIDWVKKHYETE